MAQLNGLLDQGPGLRRVRMAGVRSCESVGALLAEALQQLSHGARNEAQGTGNEARALTLFSPLDDHLTHGQAYAERLAKLKPATGATNAWAEKPGAGDSNAPAPGAEASRT